MAGGAPTKYDPKYCLEVDKYLERCNDLVTNEGKLLVKLPTFEGFIEWLNIGIAEKTLYNWRDEYPEFLQSLEKIVRSQKIKLLENGLAGTYNPTIAKLVLASNHNMRDKSEVDQTVTQTINLQGASNEELTNIIKGASS